MCRSPIEVVSRKGLFQDALLQKQARPLCQNCARMRCFEAIGLPLSERQTPQITENTEKPEEGMELLESSCVRPKQTRSFYGEFHERQGFHFVRIVIRREQKKR